MIRLGAGLIVATTLTFSDRGIAGDRQTEVSAVLDFTMKSIDGEDVYLGDFQGNVLLLVNVASKCGYTPQYENLEGLYRKYKDRGFRILAFPSNNFGQQEPGTNKEIKQFCTTQYDVTFDLFSKVSVKGPETCDLYRYLTDEQNRGKFGGEIRWNFQKFLIDRHGNVVGRFEPKDDPLGETIMQAVENTLKEPRQAEHDQEQIESASPAEG